MKETIFKGIQINVLQLYFENFHHSCRNSYTHNKISIRHLLTATSNFGNCCGQSLVVCTYKKVKVTPKQCSENFVDHFPLGKNGMAEFLRTQKLLHLLKKLVFVIKYLLLRAGF